nr:cyclic beta,2-glucan synthetase [Candidatus Cloacimonadota bacterium]
MTFSSKAFHDSIVNIWNVLSGTDPTSKFTFDELPLRAELFSADQMRLHGKNLAEIHKVATGHHKGMLLKRLAENESFLLEVYDLLMEDVLADRQIAPAGEWLLDNFYLIEEQIRTAKHHFPKSYSRELPNLANGALAGYPRVYDIALETISHGDGRVDLENLSSFVEAYQSVNILKLGELWAIPIMLRLALMENLRRVAVRIAADRMYRLKAEYWVKQITDIAAKDPQNLILVIADMARSNPPMVSSFVAELAHNLQGQVPILSLPLNWIEQRLSESGLTIEHMVRSENQQLAADQVTISNCIGSLRILSAIDWREFVESMSMVERTLFNDPADVYGKMDFTTRDNYRHIIEKLARSSHSSEMEVAQAAIDLAQNSATNKGGDDRTAHVGFYLIDKGLTKLQQSIKAHIPLTEQLGKFCHKYPTLLYVGSILLLTTFFTGCLVMKAYIDGLQGWALFLLGLLLFIGTAQLAVALVNWMATMLSKPLLLPRLDFSKGIPADLRTLVVIPTMLTSPQNIEDLIKALEIRFLANQDDYLHFGLLTDFCDSATESLPEDESLLLLVSQRIAELNEQYSHPGSDTFFLFHRPRRWNPREKIWMGYERKRGKLTDLNRILQGGSQESFSLIVGDTKILLGAKYVITLDTDTQLVRDSARQLIGTMAHPLNRPYYDESRQRVTAGYGILQPQVAISLPGSNRSLYVRMGASEPGIDPYTRSVSDVYQDLFAEGSYIGKGIYDIDAFEQALGGRFPENRILSHDLLEGSYARSGLVSDVQLYEEFPAQYIADVHRRHRWIRGDWQIAQWVMPFIPSADSHLIKNPISFLSRWKIFDNLRRSLTSAALTLLLLAGWIVFPTALHWTLTIISIIIVPTLAAAFLKLFQKPADVSLKEHLAAEMNSLRRAILEVLFTIICLPYEAFFSLDAVLRTIWRTLISHRHLLEWNPSGETGNNKRTALGSSYRTMWFAPLLSLVTITVLAFRNPNQLGMAAPILLLWFVSPAIAWWISRPLTQHEAKLSTKQITFLRKLSRKTWAFFETFVTAEQNWLPPDNFQEYPAPVIAHRTSPTNIGLSLLANLSAYDFGYISTGQLLQRSAQTLHTMEKLDKYHGHFFNWYDTQTLHALKPLYISSVDSGNLAGHLIVLQNGLRGLPNDIILGNRWLDSLADTLGILSDELALAPEPHILSQLTQLWQQLDSKIASPPDSLSAARQCFGELEKSASAIVSAVEALELSPNSLVLWWARAFMGQCHDALSELAFLAPWTDHLTKYNLPHDLLCLDHIPTLNELAGLETKLMPIITQHLKSVVKPTDKAWLSELQNLIKVASQHAKTRLTIIDELAWLCIEFSKMDYDFLYDKKRHLLSIGFNVSEHQQDSSYYDLLASEARFSSFVAIAQGKIPQESWFALGRLLTTASGDPILLSWSGSMFEYLMPLLVMPTYKNTLLDQTYKTAVARQIDYGKRRSVPWGISESGYNAIDVHLNYQYRAFGVPGLGLKRGLSEDLVVAPYASVLALMVAPEESCQNLERLATDGFEANYGFYEAIDYTPARLPRGQTHVVIKSFMAHHQGMSLLALAYLLLDRPMQKRFEADSLFQATMLLLQERVPKATAHYVRTTRLTEQFIPSASSETPIRVFSTPDTPNPEVALLSNGRYHVLVTNAGGGYSRWKNLAVTRWREDRTCDNWGMFCYIRDVASNEFWSATYQPTLKPSKHFEAIFSEGRAEFLGRDHGYDTHTEIAVSAEDDIELRRLRITNRSRNSRVIEITSYAEVVLAPQAADALHPAFSNLFVQTEIIPKSRAILCTRRPRSQNELEPWMLHLMAVHGAKIQDVSYETDRAKFIGRGNTVANPQALVGKAGIDNSTLTGSDKGGQIEGEIGVWV